MADKSEKVNMFEKASEERRQKFIRNNEFVADEIISNQPDNDIASFFDKPKIAKDGYNYYIETRIDDFFIGLGKVMKRSKSEIANQIMIMCIKESNVMKQLAQSSEEVQKLLDEFNK